METLQKTKIKIQTEVNAPVEKVWRMWTDPKHILHWNNASDDWFTPWAENELGIGGKFTYRMEARDGSAGFDFGGEYTRIEPGKLLEYTLGDGRKVSVAFGERGNRTIISEVFEAENDNPEDMQKTGWQNILENFRKHAETPGRDEMLHYEIRIDASAEKVFQTMIDKSGYSEWTSEFNPTSYFDGSWEKGSKIRFIGTDRDGRQGGMVSLIRENIPGKFISIEHTGILQDDNEITSGPKVENWKGSLENYSFSIDGDKTLLEVDIDSDPDFRPYFNATWPRALEKLKQICER